MHHAVVFYTELRHAGVDALRARHDPYASVFRDHVPFVFPVPGGAVDRQAFLRHVEAVASGWPAFRLHLAGVEASWDHWLLLGVREGGQEAARLHDALYTGILATHLRRDLRYTPHVGLGLFAGPEYDPLDPRAVAFDQEAFRRARREAEALELDFWRVVDRLTVLDVDDGLGRVRDAAVVALDTAAGRSSGDGALETGTRDLP